MAVQVMCESAQGGAVRLSQVHPVAASYAVAAAGDLPPSECLTVWVTLACGRTVQLFVNRQTGLVTVSSADKDETGGTELFRQTVGRARPAGRRYVLQPLEAEGDADG